jgi:hypothetical protein
MPWCIPEDIPPTHIPAVQPGKNVPTSHPIPNPWRCADRCRQGEPPRQGTWPSGFWGNSPTTWPANPSTLFYRNQQYRLIRRERGGKVPLRNGNSTSLSGDAQNLACCSGAAGEPALLVVRGREGGGRSSLSWSSDSVVCWDPAAATMRTASVAAQRTSRDRSDSSSPVAPSRRMATGVWTWVSRTGGSRLVRFNVRSGAGLMPAVDHPGRLTRRTRLPARLRRRVTSIRSSSNAVSHIR